IDFDAGSDRLTLLAGGTLTVSNAETIIGRTASDIVTLGAALTGGLVDLGGGSDSLTLASGGGTLTVANVETLVGGAGADVVTLGTKITGGTIDLAGGDDVLTLATGGTVTATNIETVVGSSGVDVIVITGSTGRVVDLGGGADRFIGGTGSDTVTGGAGADLFTFTAIAQSPTGTGRDVITDFTPGTDKLVFQGLLSGSFTYVGAHTNAFAGGGNSSARFNDGTKVLEVDTNGDSIADMEVTLTGVNGSGLSAPNFQWN
ncbi:MAG: type I secretion C-terminal target domain-containing protein, partial [Geminicoccaceae bacterium]